MQQWMDENDPYISMSQPTQMTVRKRKLEQPSQASSEQEKKPEEADLQEGRNLKWRAFSILRRQFLRIERIKQQETVTEQPYLLQ